jgi:hypothetical protein
MVWPKLFRVIFSVWNLHDPPPLFFTGLPGSGLRDRASRSDREASLRDDPPTIFQEIAHFHAVILRYAAISIQILVHPIAQHLRQTGIEVIHVGGSHLVHRLPQPATLAVVGIGDSVLITGIPYLPAGEVVGVIGFH